MAGVWILAEKLEQSFELLTIGLQLAGDIGTNLAAISWQPETADDLIAHGADEVILLPPLPAGQALEAYIPAIVEKSQMDQPELILIAATLKGREMAARIASRLDAGLGSECQSLYWDAGRKSLVVERLIYGGAGVQKVCCLGRPQMATIPPRSFEPAPRLTGREGRITKLDVSPFSPVTVLEKKASEHQTRDIAEARVVVCVGRGMEKPEDLEKARELAGLIGGEVGCTRPISEELHWMPEDTCIGLSGKNIKADLYIGLGVSGQIQHLTGIRDTRIICIINKDENAPIFAAADYGIVGDLYQVLPGLIEEIKQVKA